MGLSQSTLLQPESAGDPESQKRQSCIFEHRVLNFDFGDEPLLAARLAMLEPSFRTSLIGASR